MWKKCTRGIARRAHTPRARVIIARGVETRTRAHLHASIASGDCAGAMSSSTVAGFSRGAAAQLGVAIALTAALGGVLQLHKLASIDSAGREFAETSSAVKVSFLLPFALAKSSANLAVGRWADAYGRRRVTVLGWSVGAIAPVLGMIATRVKSGGFGVVTMSALFLGCAQGLTWTALVLACVDICGSTRRGFASGLNETVGYTAIALFAHVYGAMESSGVTCSWVDETRSDACVASNAEQKCVTPDDWTSACVGACVCRGYMQVPMGIELLMCLIGLIVSVVLLKESSGGHRFAVGGSSWVNPIEEDESTDKGVVGVRISREDDEFDRPGAASFAAAKVETFREAMYRTSWANKNTAVVCYAAFCANFETAVAWGLMSVWARDQLALTGRQRDVFTACYSFMKGFTQIGSGMLSDKIGRKTPMAFGLIGGAISLLIATFGAGFRGHFTVGASDVEKLKSTEYAVLTFSSVFLGFCTGVTYPLLAAAAVDHAPDANHYASTLGVVRFWRDLGYAMGVPLAAIADSSSTEVALILVSLVMLSAGVAVAKVYAEKNPNNSDVGYVETASDEPGDVELPRIS